MGIDKLRNIVGATMLLSHVISVILLTYLFLLDAFFFSQFTTLVAIVSPILGVYSLTYLNHLKKTSKKGKPTMVVKSEYAIISISLCVLFSVMIVGIIFLKGFSHISISFEELKGLIAIFEVVFGGIAARLYFHAYE